MEIDEYSKLIATPAMVTDYVTCCIPSSFDKENVSLWLSVNPWKDTHAWFLHEGSIS